MTSKPILRTTQNILEYSSRLPYIKTGLLIDYVEKINPGKLRSQDYDRTSYSLLLNEIGPWDWDMAFQSQQHALKWLHQEVVFDQTKLEVFLSDVIHHTNCVLENVNELQPESLTQRHYMRPNFTLTELENVSSRMRDRLTMEKKSIPHPFIPLTDILSPVLHELETQKMIFSLTTKHQTISPTSQIGLYSGEKLGAYNQEKGTIFCNNPHSIGYELRDQSVVDQFWHARGEYFLNTEYPPVFFSQDLIGFASTIILEEGCTATELHSTVSNRIGYEPKINHLNETLKSAIQANRDILPVHYDGFRFIRPEEYVDYTRAVKYTSKVLLKTLVAPGNNVTHLL